MITLWKPSSESPKPSDRVLGNWAEIHRLYRGVGGLTLISKMEQWGCDIIVERCLGGMKEYQTTEVWKKKSEIPLRFSLTL